MPNFFQNCDAMVTEFKAEVADPTVTVHGLDATVARTSTLACSFYRAIAL